MVVTEATQRSSPTEGRVRPLEPGRDLRAVVELIAEGFGGDLDPKGQAALRELRWTARLWPLLWWLAQTDPALDDAFKGFVWEEPVPGEKKGLIVGNVSLNRAPGSERRWIICNVVVREGHRGRGIGRQLTEAAIAEVQALAATGVVLQVYQDNVPALQLYTDFGFQEAAGEAELVAERVRAVALLDAPGYDLRRWSPADGQAALQLVRLVTPEALQWLRPIPAEEYRSDWWSRLGQRVAGLTAGRQTYRLVALRDGRLVALMTITVAYRRGDHHLTLVVHPDHAGKVEAALISRACHMLDVAPAAPVTAIVDKDHAATLKVLHDYGFKEQRTLLTMTKDFR
jgi:ribosomal protein S18 acetylase RimI-like enzyme